MPQKSVSNTRTEQEVPTELPIIVDEPVVPKPVRVVVVPPTQSSSKEMAIQKQYQMKEAKIRATILAEEQEEKKQKSHHILSNQAIEAERTAVNNDFETPSDDGLSF